MINGKMNKAGFENFLSMTDEVADALADNKPVVALESTIISHGMPYPQNVETARLVENIVRDNGAVPATIAIMDGRLCAGLSDSQITTLGKTGLAALKVSRRDIPFAVSRTEVIGATTVAATMIIASMAGIKVFATGGIGGVHRHAETTFDISADLQELASTDVAVVCAGAKSILDIGLTQEYLETHGVPVIGYDTDSWPAFYTRHSQYTVDYNLQSPCAIANALRCKWQLGLDGGVLICVPVPVQFEQDADKIEQVILNALEEMQREGVTGKDTTPFLLARIAAMTDGESLDTNIKLVLNNAAVAARIAVSYSNGS